MASVSSASAKELKHSTNEMAAGVADVPQLAKDVESAVNDPDFAVICAFLQKFGKDVGVNLPNFNNLHQWLVNTDEVSQPLREMHIKLLRKTRRTVHEKCWEVPLSKFCFSYSAQDAWEIERFGYKKSSLKVKLRVLRHLLECQFERNNKFRTKFLTQNADSLRSQPIGRDKLGHTYWLTQDDDCNLRIYQEHLDEDIWRVVASNRDELVVLIARLRGNEVVLPSTDIGIIDEDTSSSNSCDPPIEKLPPPEEQDDSQEEPPALKVPNLRIKLSGNKKSSEQDQDAKDKTEYEQSKAENTTEKPSSKESDESHKKVKPLIIQRQIGGSSPSSSLKRKTTNDDEEVSSPVRDEPQDIKRPRPSLLDSRRASKPNKYFKASKGEEDYESSSLDGELGESELDDDEEECEEEDIDSAAAEEGENEEKEIEEFDDTDEEEDDGDRDAAVGEPIEDPPVYVRGNGAGKECKGGNVIDTIELSSYYCSTEDEFKEIFGEAIEEETLYIYGAGAGNECLVGNKTQENETNTSSHEPKATFFFGEPGCLKLSPIKLTPTTPISLTKTKKSSQEEEDNIALKEKEFDEKKEMKETTNVEIEIKSKNVENSVSNDVSNDSVKNEEPKLNLNQKEVQNLEQVADEFNGENKETAECSNLNVKICKEDKQSAIQKGSSKDAKEAEANATNDTTAPKNAGHEQKNNSESEKATVIEITNQDKVELESASKLVTNDETKDLREKENANKTSSLEKLATKCGVNNIETVLALSKPTANTKTNELIAPNAPSAAQHIHFNRKRRLTDFSKPTPPPPLPPVRNSTSESDFDTHSDQQADNTATTGDDGNEDVGGKRLKIRPKCTNAEVRKKVEAQLVEKKYEQEETTSSSGDEEARRPRKMITPKRNLQKATLNQTVEANLVATLTSLPNIKTSTNEKAEDTNADNAQIFAPKPKISADESLDGIGVKEEQKVVAATTTTMATSVQPLVKSKPTLSEIIEKKLKKTPPKSALEVADLNTTPTSNKTIESIFSLPKKSPVTKPLKKNLLTQLRESIDEAVPRKRAIGENLPSNTAVETCKEDAVDPVVTSISVTTPTTSENNVELDLKAPERTTPERQRKRQSTEEVSTIKSVPTNTKSKPTDDGYNGKANIDSVKKCKEYSIIESLESVKKSKEDDVVKTEKTTEEKPDQTSAKEDQQNADDGVISAVGRRSSRRCAASVVYAELPQPKRTRGAAKITSSKKESGKPDETNVSPTKSLASSEDVMKSEKSAKIEADDEKKIVVKKETKKNDNDTKASEKKKGKPNETTKPETTVKAEKSNADAETNLEEQIKVNIVQKNVAQEKISAEITKKPTPPTTTTLTSATGHGRVGRKKREVDMINIIEPNDSEMPVRQSRRIAQQKIREEAERRKLEEIALRSMKQELKKKKKAEKEADPTVVEPSAESSSASASSESEKETPKRKLKKKCPGKDGWSSGSEEEDEPEEEEEHPPHYDIDPGSPLFKSDHEFSPESDIEDETQVVPMKRARTARKEDADENDEQIGGDEEACQKCGKSDHPEWILLCDNCDKGYHCSCLSPVIFYIPEGNWYCPPCQQTQLIEALEKQLKEFDELVEKKRTELEEEKRLAEVAEREQQARLKVEEEQRKERRKLKQKKRHRSVNGNSSSESVLNGEGQDESKDEESDAACNNDNDDNGEKEDGIKLKERKQNNKNDTADKNKRRRGEGRNRRRKAAARGTRRRRRLDKGSDSSDSGGSSSSGKSGSESGSGASSSSSSDSFSDSDDEPIYKLRKRRQINVSYRLNEYDDLINSALKKEMDNIAGSGNLGRGKDISTIIEADKEEKERLREVEEQTGMLETSTAASKPQLQKTCLNIEDDEKEGDENEDAKRVKPKAKPKLAIKKKPRKLTTLDISSEDDGSDEDFKTSSFDDEDEEDTLVSASDDSDTSLEVYRRRGKGGKKKQRKAARRAARQRRKDRRFVVEESDEEEEAVAKPKKKRKEDSDYTETETDDDELSENSENIDSAELCDDTTSDSDGAWHPSKRKKQRKSGTAQTAPKSKPKKPQTKKKQLEYSDDDISESEEEEDEDDDDIGGGKGSGKQPRSQPLIPVKSSKTNAGKGKGKGNASAAAKKKQKKGKSENELSFSSGSEDSTRARTRGRRYAYIEDFEDDSSDGGIKPGVHRPDTPPEEREKFIKKQEEIKRMLAEKNAEGAKLVATPRLTPIKAVDQAIVEKDKKSPVKQDSLSTVPLSVIRQAKVLDIDYLHRKGTSMAGELENVGEEDVDSEFDDADLPDDLPEDMDEDAIARMVEEEEEFGAAAAVRELPAPDDILRTPTKSKSKDVSVNLPLSSASSKTGGSAALEALAQMQGGGGPPATLAINSQGTSASGLQEPTRKRFPMPTFHPPLLRHQYPQPPHTQSGNIMLHGGQNMPRHGPPTHLLQNALCAPLGQPLNRNFGLSHSPMPARQLLPPSRPLPPAPTLSTAAGTAPVPAAEARPRGRRKKITPLRDNAQKQATAASAAAATAAAVTAAAVTAAAVSSVEKVPIVLPTPVESRTSNVAVSSVSSVIKSPSTSTLSVAQPPQLYKPPTDSKGQPQASVITRMTHLPPPNRMIFQSADVARFYSALTSSGAPGLSRSLPSNAQRPHRGPPLQMPPGLAPPPSNYGPQHSARHPPPHLNSYRPPIYGNPSYGQPRPMPPTGANVRLGAPPTAGPDYISGARRYPPYGYYPPPPPLTTTHHPPPVSSVIVSAPPSVITTHAPPAPPPPSTTNHTTAAPTVIGSSRSNTTLIKSPPAEEELHTAPKKNAEPTSTSSSPSQKKQLMTLDVYAPSNVKSPLAMGGGESSGSQPDAAEDSPTATVAPTSQSKASEFSGLVSYFSSQHDDYNS